jgi:excisionase family DNA binding protein
MEEPFGRLLTAAEVAERLGYMERYVWKLGGEGVLPRVKLPGRKYVRFAERDVERFIAAGFVAASAVSRAAGLVASLPRRF